MMEWFIVAAVVALIAVGFWRLMKLAGRKIEQAINRGFGE